MDTQEDKQLQPFNDETYVPRENAISLLDIIGVLVKRWKLIFFTTAVAAIWIVIILLYSAKLPQGDKNNPMPNVFSPEALILIQSSSGGGGLSSLLQSSGGSSLASLLGGAGTSPTETSAALAQELLTENTIVDQIVKEFDIIKKHNITTKPIANSRDIVKKSLKTRFDLKTGIITVSYSDTDPAFATQIVNRMVQLLEERFKNLTLDRVLRKKAFLEDQLNQVQHDLSTAEEKLVSFQNRYKIVDIGTQTAEMAKRLGDYRNQLYQLELQRQSLLQYSKTDSPSVIRIQNQIDQLRQFMNELETGFKVYSAEAIPLDKVAELGVQFQNLQTEVQIQAKLYATLRQEYEAAKIEEQDNSGTFQIIEKAQVPEVKSAPSRSVIAIVVTLVAFFLAALTAFVMEYFDKVKQDPIEAEKLQSMKRVFRRGKV
ncbi:MAG TPA: GNVR domain-containing protein [Spirochaetia bacterium]|nr:GNVR domain-containing protein [Spirochaetia bacterium]